MGAECDIDRALEKSKGAPLVLDWMRFSLLIFLAEWGDRSMLATVTLAATRSALGVFIGGCLGHALATIVAAVSGRLLGTYISDRIVKTVGGILLLTFGVSTLVGVY